MPDGSYTRQLLKAKLIPAAGEAHSTKIEFQFNPKEFSISRSIETAQNGRDEKLRPKISFKGPNMVTININEVTFDTYESGGDVRKLYVSPLLKAMDCSKGGMGGAKNSLSPFPFSPPMRNIPTKEKRPPLFTFTWGKNRYLRRCFVKQVDVTYKLFLPDGTPVRATAKITLSQVAEIFYPDKK